MASRNTARSARASTRRPPARARRRSATIERVGSSPVKYATVISQVTQDERAQLSDSPRNSMHGRAAMLQRRCNTTATNHSSFCNLAGLQRRPGRLRLPAPLFPRLRSPACSPRSKPVSSLSASPPSIGATSAQATDITGAGATFIYPILSKWSDTYNNKTGNKINYQSIGSGGGIAQIKAGTVDLRLVRQAARSQRAQRCRPRAVSVGDRRRRAGRQHRRRRARQDPASPVRSSPTSTRARSRPGTIPRSRRSIPTSSSATARSPSCIARTVRARRSTSSTTFPRFRRSGNRRSAKAPRCRGRSASAARATKASLRT